MCLAIDLHRSAVVVYGRILKLVVNALMMQLLDGDMLLSAHALLYSPIARTPSM